MSLGEKLLLTILAKVVNLVPDGGIWMNTQRPEWNDANNALVGKGMSVVTLAYLRRALTLATDLLADDLTVTSELASLLTDVHAALDAHVEQAATGFDDQGRRAVMDALGAAGTAYRTRVYAGFSGERTRVRRRCRRSSRTRRSTSTPRCGPTVARTACTTRTTCWTCATGRPSVVCRRCSRVRSRCCRPAC